MSRRPVIAVIGSGSADKEVLEVARDLGRAIAEAGCHLLCGGRGGVMEAACRGHHEARVVGIDPVLTLGVLPGSDRSEANDFVDIALPTGIGLARNVLIVSSSDGVVAVAGGSGTLSEIAYAWQFGKPVTALSTSGGWSEELAGRRLDDKRNDTLHPAASPREAIQYLFKALNLDS